MKKILLLALTALLLCGAAAFADKPIFNVSASGEHYGQYSGTIKYIYVNDANLILMYFDTPLNISETAGYVAYHNSPPVLNPNAAVVSITNTPEFAKYFYATALMAQALNKKVIIQMRKTLNGYVVADRIWLAE